MNTLNAKTFKKWDNTYGRAKSRILTYAEASQAFTHYQGHPEHGILNRNHGPRELVVYNKGAYLAIQAIYQPTILEDCTTQIPLEVDEDNNLTREVQRKIYSYTRDFFVETSNRIHYQSLDGRRFVSLRFIVHPSSDLEAKYENAFKQITTIEINNGIGNDLKLIEGTSRALPRNTIAFETIIYDEIFPVELN